MDDTKVVNFTLLRDRLVSGANNPQGAKLSVYQGHYLPRSGDAQSGGQGGESPASAPRSRPVIF